MNNEKIIEAAQIYLKEGQTIKTAAAATNVSKRTLQLNLPKLKELDPGLYKLVLTKKEMNQEIGRKKGGSDSKRGPSYTKEDVEAVIDFIIKNHATYKLTSAHTGFSISTICEMVHSKYVSPEEKEKLSLIAEANRHHSLVESEPGNRQPGWDDTGDVYEGPYKIHRM